MNDDQNFIIGQALKTTRYATKQLFKPGEGICIVSARVLIETLRAFGIQAGPRPAKLEIFNKAFQDAHAAGVELAEMDTDKAHIVSVGLGIAPAGPRDWAGHLVVLAHAAAGELLLDATLDCYSRPQYEMELEPAAFRINEAVWLAEGEFGAKLNDCLLVYRPDLGNNGYRSAPDWTRRRKYRAIADAVIQLVENQIKAKDRADGG